MKKNTKIILIIFIIVILALIACYAIIGMNHDNNGQDVFNQNNVLFKPKIGIISALDTETGILVKNLDNKQEKEIAGSTYYLGNIGNYQVIIVRCGMGKVSAAARTQAMIDEYSPDCIINTGSAGALSEDLNVGDMVMSNSTVEWDLDTIDLGNPRGYVSSLDKVFMNASPEIGNEIKSFIPSDVNVKIGLVVSGDQFVSTDEQKSIILSSFPNALCEDMEGAAIGHVCTQNNVPFCVVRCISNNANGDSGVDFAEFSADAGEKSASILLKLLKQ